MWNSRVVIVLSIVLLAGPASADPASVNAAPPLPTLAPVMPGSGVSPPPSGAPAFPIPDAAQAQAMMQTFARMHAAQQQLRVQTRAQMLGSLSPAHRTLVANIVGQLAISPNPDQVAAARQLDAMLSPNEQQAILRVNASALAQAQAMFEQMHAQMQSQMTPEQRAALARQFSQTKADLQKRLTPEQRAALERQVPQWKGTATVTSSFGLPATAFASDAGSVLLRTLVLPTMMPNMLQGTTVHGAP